MKEKTGGNKMIITWTITIIILTIGIAGAAGLLCYRKNEKVYDKSYKGVAPIVGATVTVYDTNGEIIRQYRGRFDVAYDSERIKFDDENGKRHIIYYHTETVIIDEE